jgi:hypothetical protein
MAILQLEANGITIIGAVQGPVVVDSYEGNRQFNMQHAPDLLNLAVIMADDDGFRQGVTEMLNSTVSTMEQVGTTGPITVSIISEDPDNGHQRVYVDGVSLPEYVEQIPSLANLLFI